jgi:hypothetical protein
VQQWSQELGAEATTVTGLLEEDNEEVSIAQDPAGLRNFVGLSILFSTIYVPVPYILHLIESCPIS